MALTQDDRAFSLSTPLGPDVLLLDSLEGVEGLSIPFRFDLQLISEQAPINPKDLIGQKVDLCFELPEGSRTLNGYISRLTRGDSDFSQTHYRAEMVPWLWFLQKNLNCRIFQSKTAPEIIKEVFDLLGFSDYEVSLEATYDKRGYCVQYRESDFDFVHRLMEEEGIYYFFKHEESKHTMVLGDSPNGHTDCPEAASVVYRHASGGEHTEETIFQWSEEESFHSGKVTLEDYYFPSPTNDQSVNTQTVTSVADNSKFELYDYPGAYAKRFDGDGQAGDVKPSGDRVVKIRMEEEETSHWIASGRGRVRAFGAGYKFTLEEHPREEANTAWVLSRVHHSVSNNLGEASEAFYENSFECVPLEVPFRPPRVTPKPLMRGCQTAVVVGKSGEEIWTDKYGRIIVQFHWDREGGSDEHSSCWVRVGTPWAGKQWGMIHIPRIGQEVIVDFLEGDPDRPIVVGSVYNGQHMPPFELPAEQTKSGLRTRSTKEGSSDNCNELHFEDKKGEENIFFHAEKDFRREVENDDSLHVGHDQTIEVINDRTETVKEGNELVTIEKGTRTVVVGEGDDTHDVKQGSRTVNVDQGDDTLNVKQGDRTLNVDTGDETVNVKTGSRTVNVDTGDHTTNVKTGNCSLSVDTGNHEMVIKLGDQTTKVDLGKHSTEAMQSIELKVGSNSIKIDQSGVTIKGLMVTVEGQAMTTVKGAMTDIKGDGMLMAKGGITMIG